MKVFEMVTANASAERATPSTTISMKLKSATFPIGARMHNLSILARLHPATMGKSEGLQARQASPYARSPRASGRPNSMTRPTTSRMPMDSTPRLAFPVSAVMTLTRKVPMTLA